VEMAKYIFFQFLILFIFTLFYIKCLIFVVVVQITCISSLFGYRKKLFIVSCELFF
jgi:hypothetical protein